MFIKPLKIKSNNQLKGTERKKFCDLVAQAFPSLKSEDIQSLLPRKEAVSLLKIIAYDGQTGKIYCIAKLPLFFQLNTFPQLFPTMFTLWQYPDLLYTYITRLAVVPKLSGGANLMLPGVITDDPPNFNSFGKLQKGHPVAVITDDNKAPVAVGVTALSSEEMYMSAGFGKCIEIIHVIGDSLYNLDKPPARPKLGAPSILKHDSITNFFKNVDSERICTEVSEVFDNIDNVNITINKMSEETNVDNKNVEYISSSMQELSTNDIKEENNIDSVQEMDSLLEYCFLKACKISLKKGDLPMITSKLFKNHVINVCPPGKNVDVKKSSYKKLSVFLAKMKDKGVIDTSSVKGVESLLSIKNDHPLLQNLVITEDLIVQEKELLHAPVISECFKVTAAVIPVLTKFGYDKGDILKRTEVRKCFTEYVKFENLQDGKMLKINPQLADILRTKENQTTLTMEDGINKFIGKMTHIHEITVAGNKLFHSGKLDPIDITVATRSGNKKVTLINNLEIFGIKLEEFSKECQGIGASATITDVPGKKTPSVLVQGNQVLYVYKLLTEKYLINKNHIKGLEFAPKKKK